MRLTCELVESELNMQAAPLAFSLSSRHLKVKMSSLAEALWNSIAVRGGSMEEATSRDSREALPSTQAC